MSVDMRDKEDNTYTITLTYNKSYTLAKHNFTHTYTHTHTHPAILLPWQPTTPYL